MMKRAAIITVLIFAVCCLSGCQSSDYKKAVATMESGEYSVAIEQFSKLNGYEDSNERITKCKYELADIAIEQCDWDSAITYLTGLNYQDSENLLEICLREQGMRDSADNGFLAAIEDSVLNRMQQASDDEDLAKFVNSELSRLESFEDAVFYDDELERLALQYIGGLKLQKQAFDEQYSTYQILWYEGLVERCTALKELSEKYGLLSDNSDFQDTYIVQLDTLHETLNKLKAVDADLLAQLDNVAFEYVDYCTLMAPYTNNTEYAFDVQFYFFFYDENGVRIDDSIKYFSNIKAGSQNELQFYFPEDEYKDLSTFSCEFFWELAV